MSVRNKLLILIVLPLLLTTGLAIFSIQQLRTVSSTALQVANNSISPLTRLSKITRLYTQGVVDVAHKSKAQMIFWSEAKTLFNDNKAIISQEWLQYQQAILSSQEQKILTDSKTSFKNLELTLNKLEKILNEESSYQLGNFIDFELYAGIEPVMQVLEQLIAVQKQMAQASGQQAKKIAEQAIMTIYIVLAVLILIMFFASFWIIRNIRWRISVLLNTITNVEKDNDFTLRVELPAGDEFGDMGRRFNRMLTSIGKLVSDLQMVGQQLDNSATSLVTINEDARLQVHNQQQETKKLSLVINQVNHSAELVLSNIDQSQQATEHANNSTNQGVNTVQDTINAINQLSQQVNTSVDGIQALKTQSEDIGSVMAVIKNIADQTNLLALNAAIEAARAGEQGRGFSVVADEVRQLASRTADSTQEIQDIVEGLQLGTQKAAEEMLAGSKVSATTVEHAQLSGEALTQIENGVAIIVNKNNDISKVAKEQLILSEQLSSQAEIIDDLAQQTVDLSNNSTVIGNDVTRLSEQLKNELKQFKTG